MRALPLLALLVSLSASLTAQDKVSVYVTSIGAQNGFTDPSKDNRDTAKDLANDIKGKRELRLVDKPEDAAIVLTVLSRNTEDSLRGDLHIVHVRFTAGEFTADLTGSGRGSNIASSGAWGRAADKIVDQVVEWVKANRGRLTEAR